MQLTNIGFYMQFHLQQYICKLNFIWGCTHHASTNVALPTHTHMHDAHITHTVGSPTWTLQAPFHGGNLGLEELMSGN